MQKSTHSILLDIIFPRRCISCEILLSGIEESYICNDCSKLILLSTRFRCPFCTRATILGKTCNSCKSNHYLDRLLVATDYSDQLIEKIVKTLKYRFVPGVAHDIAKIMSRYLLPRIKYGEINLEDTILLPIPLHEKRLRWRGFNQAEEIAIHISNTLNIKIASDLLLRTKHIKPQADIKDKNNRIDNARNLFFANYRPKEKNIILIDDVASTSATLDNASKTLKEAGAKSIIGFVFARGNQ